MQQTPKPLAHDPDEVPPLVEHSDLKIIIDQILFKLNNKLIHKHLIKKKTFDH